MGRQLLTFKLQLAHNGALLALSCFQLRFQRLHILAGADVLRLERLVIVHDLADVADFGEEVRHTGGIKENVHIGAASALLHSAHTGTEQGVLPLLRGGGRVQLGLGLRNLLIVERELLLDHRDLVLIALNALIQRGLAGYVAGMLALQCVNIALQLVRACL